MSTLRDTSTIDTLVIHCADTPNGAMWHAEDIDDWHREGGFFRNVDLAPNVSPHLQHIGYHYVIETTGRIVRGRSLEETGAHVKGHNARSIGICLIGLDQYTLDQWHALKRLVISLQIRFKHRLEVAGHRDLDPAKTCPGFDVRAWINGGMQIPPPHRPSMDIK